MFIYDLQLVCKVRVSIWNSHTHFLLIYLPPPPPLPLPSPLTLYLSLPPQPPSFLLCSVVFSTLGRISRGNKEGDSKKVSWVKKSDIGVEGVCD